jgi:hypothetical protein
LEIVLFDPAQQLLQKEQLAMHVADYVDALASRDTGLISRLQLQLVSARKKASECQHRIGITSIPQERFL